MTAPAPLAESELIAVSINSSSILEDCKTAGIDPHAAIPTDYTKYENGTYHFKKGSKASEWTQAQLELDPSAEELNKRTFTNIGIGMWTQDLCKGEGVWAGNVQYSVNSYVTGSYYSVGIRYRGIRNNERLDFSKL